MRKRIVLLCLLLCVSCVFLPSCDTSILGESPAFVMQSSFYIENDRYIVFSGHYCEMLFDKTDGTRRELSLESKEILVNTYRVEFTDTGFDKFAFTELRKYDVDTGNYDYSEYYDTVVHFDLSAKEISREVSDEMLDEAQMLERFSKLYAATQDFGFYFANGPYDYVDIEEEPQYTDDQQAVRDYAESMPQKLVGEYHCTSGQAKYFDGKIWFYVVQANKKDWAGQRAIVEGIYEISVVCYDPNTKEFETVFSGIDKQSVIYFTDSYIITLDGSKLLRYNYGEKKPKTIYRLENDECDGMMTTFGDYLVIECITQLDDLVTILDWSGTVIYSGKITQ